MPSVITTISVVRSKFCCRRHRSKSQQISEMGIKQSKRTVDISSTPKKGGDTPAKDAVVAEVTGNGDVAKVENGDVKPEVTNGDVVKKDVKEEVVEEAEKEKGEGDLKETEENP